MWRSSRGPSGSPGCRKVSDRTRGTRDRCFPRRTSRARPCARVAWCCLPEATRTRPGSRSSPATPVRQERRRSRFSSSPYGSRTLLRLVEARLVAERRVAGRQAEGRARVRRVVVSCLERGPRFDRSTEDGLRNSLIFSERSSQDSQEMSITDTGSPFPRHLPGTETVEFGPFRFDHAERVLTRDGEEIRLPPRVVGLLQFLLERQGKVVSKQALIDGVWSGTAVTETSLTEAISILRQALGDDAQDPRYLETVHRRGYRFRKVGLPSAEQAVSTPPEAGSATLPAQPAKTPALLIAGAIVVIVAIAVAAILWRSTPRKPKPAHVTISTAGELREWSSLAISPDGRDVIYVAKQNSEVMLYHRSLDSFESRAIAGTKNGFYPFFSPDGEWVGFTSDGKLMKVKMNGGEPITICRSAGGGGATWLRDGSIIFANPMGGLSRVSAGGGTPETLTVPDSVRGEVGHVSPHVLPDGKSVLFTIFSTTVHAAKVAVLSLDTKTRRVILDHAGGARYVPGGH